MYRPPPVGVIGTRIYERGQRADCSGHQHRRSNVSEAQRAESLVPSAINQDIGTC